MSPHIFENILMTAIAARKKPKILNEGVPGFGGKIANYMQRVCQALPYERVLIILRDHVSHWRLPSCQRKMPDNGSKKVYQGAYVTKCYEKALPSRTTSTISHMT